MFHSVGRIMGWAKNYRKRMILGFVCSFFATWCTAGPVMLAAWALGRMIGNAWGENELSGSLPWLCLSGIVFLAVHTAIFVHVRSLIAPHLAHHICGQFLCRPTCDKIPLREWERLNPPELMDAPVEHPLQ